MKILSIILFVLYLLTWTIAGLYFGNSGIVNNQYFVEINNIPEKDFNPEPVDTIFSNTGIIQEIRYKEYVDNKGIGYGSRGDFEVAQIQKRMMFQWFLFNESETLILIFASCFLGGLGAIVRLTKEMVIDKLRVDKSRILLLPVAGFFNGFIILSISYAIPKYLTNEKEVSLNPGSVMVLSLLAGIYIEIFMAWLNSLATSLFKNNKKQEI